MKNLILLIFALICVSCAKIGYLYEQGIGQVKLLYEARDNEEVLKDPNVSDEIKIKIKKVLKYKKFFYDYWHLESSDIYSKTNILNRDAVTYLVIASKDNEISPKKECFLFAGCFPYLGFFNKDSAKEHEIYLKGRNFDTYLRKVPAYSTLGRLNDPILSTFLKYGEFSLAETVFHELFHTIFFIKGEVDLNENLANYFGKQMLYIYFNKRKDELDMHFHNLSKSRIIREQIVEAAKSLKEILKDKNDWRSLKDKFLKQTFPGQMKLICKEHKIENCWPLKIQWNNAVFAAFMTYEKSQNKIEKLVEANNFSLREFFTFIKSEYQTFNDSDDLDSQKFENYLFRSIN